MSPKHNYFQKIGMVLMGLCLALTASASPTPAASAETEKLHIPLIRPGLAAEIRTLQFYGSEYYGSVEYHKRKSRYENRFMAAKTKYINWELVLDHPIPREETDKFLIAATVYDASGRVVTKSDTVAWIETDMTWSQWGGTFDVKTWTPGAYRVVITAGARESMKEYMRSSFVVAGEGDDFQNLQARVMSLTFFEAGESTPDEAQRFYRNRFQQAQTRYIHWELKLAYPPPQKLTQFTINAVWYGPEGNILADLPSKRTIQADWDSSWHCGGYGTATPGSWRPGTYRLVLKINGKEVAQGSFQVIGKEADAGRQPGDGDDFRNLHSRVVSLRFFEGDGGVSDKAHRVYLDRFPQSKTRYIQWELELTYPPPQKLMQFTMNAIWYGPDGKILDDFPEKRTIQPDWGTSWHTGSYGAAAPGSWHPGTYRLVLKVNDREVARGSFQVVADKAEAVPKPGPNPLDKLGAKISAIKFFEGPNQTPADDSRNFRRAFEQASTRYIYVQVEFAMTYLPNPPTKKFTQTVDLLFIDSQGRIFKKIASETLEFGYTAKPFIIGYGWDTPGKWPPDTYQVVIEAQGRELGRGSFRVK